MYSSKLRLNSRFDSRLQIWSIPLRDSIFFYSYVATSPALSPTFWTTRSTIAIHKYLYNNIEMWCPVLPYIVY